jgi:hypothetical protein
MGLGVEELMVWQPNPALLDLNHRPSLITLTIEKFQLKNFCRFPAPFFDAFTVNKH